MSPSFHPLITLVRRLVRKTTPIRGSQNKKPLGLHSTIRTRNRTETALRSASFSPSSATYPNRERDCDHHGSDSATNGADSTPATSTPFLPACPSLHAGGSSAFATQADPACQTSASRMRAWQLSEAELLPREMRPRNRLLCRRWEVRVVPERVWGLEKVLEVDEEDEMWKAEEEVVGLWLRGQELDS